MPGILWGLLSRYMFAVSTKQPAHSPFICMEQHPELHPLPVFVSETDTPGGVGLGREVLLWGLLPFGDNITDLQVEQNSYFCSSSATSRLANTQRFTLMPPCTQCSSSRPEGSSVYRAKPDSPVFLMPVSRLRRHWNSSTVVDASKLTTCQQTVQSRKQTHRSHSWLE